MVCQKSNRDQDRPSLIFFLKIFLHDNIMKVLTRRKKPKILEGSQLRAWFEFELEVVHGPANSDLETGPIDNDENSESIQTGRRYPI